LQQTLHLLLFVITSTLLILLFKVFELGALAELNMKICWIKNLKWCSGSELWKKYENTAIVTWLGHSGCGKKSSP